MNDATTDLASIPTADLDQYAFRCDGEWGYRDRGVWSGGLAVHGFATPDADGVTVYVEAGFRREELPELIGFLTAVYRASDPEAGEVQS